jgi:hypothetical protein
MMLGKLRPHLSYANVIATLALFLALGGGAYAAIRLPKNSVGSKQLKANAVSSAKVKKGSLLSGDFKAGQLPAGRVGPQGPKGDIGQPGQTGPQGPGATSVEGHYDNNSNLHDITTINGLTLRISCESSGLGIYIQRADVSDDFYAWGTKSNDTTLSRATVLDGPGFGGDNGHSYTSAAGTTSAELDVVAEATSPGGTIKWTRVDMLGVRGTACNYHALVIPPS